MIKMLIMFVIGAGSMCLYLNPGDMDGMKQTGMDALYDGATIVIEMVPEPKD